MKGIILPLLLAAGCVHESSDPPRRNHLVSVVTEAGGAVVSTPPGISCGVVCTGSFAHGTVVTLEPRAEAGARFAGWSGACAGRKLCVLAVNGDLSTGAAFELADGSGKVPANRPERSDLDRDALGDAVDRCPVDAEDHDDFEDADGCPDTDNDRDGFADADDRCPNVPEDRDGDQDDDGCPETGNTDRDGDGMLDPDDKCPDDPEDMDGFQDDDGCPDPDNDQDAVLDVDDLCPNEPENRNGIQDDDGCPERR